MATITTVTLNPSIDVSCSVGSVIPEHKLRCSHPAFHPGGGGINVARALKRLGHDAVAMWAGGGAMATLLAELLDGEAIRHRPRRISGMTRQNFIVYESSSGQQYRFGTPGPSMSEGEAQGCIDELSAISPGPEILVLSGSLPPGVPEDFYARVASAVPGSCRVILDTSGEPLRKSLSAPVYLLKPSLRELGQIAGREFASNEEVEEFARSLIERFPVQVIVTSLGARGALMVSRSGGLYLPAPVVPTRSKVGAGDSMVAGMCSALAQGLPLPEVLKQGVAAGAAAVMTDGTELCLRDDVERIARQLPPPSGIGGATSC